MQCPYVGITNQGATCYMNSYLQFLYMTKEFRAFLFSLSCRPDKTSKEKDSIPYQLQKLFAKLNIKKNKETEIEQDACSRHNTGCRCSRLSRVTRVCQRTHCT